MKSMTSVAMEHHSESAPVMLQMHFSAFSSVAAMQERARIIGKFTVSPDSPTNCNHPCILQPPVFITLDA